MIPVALPAAIMLADPPATPSYPPGGPIGPGQIVLPQGPPPTSEPPPPAPQVEVQTEEGEPAAAPEAAPSEPEPEIIAELEEIKPDKDPLEGFNRVSFKVSMFLDKVLIRPASIVYSAVLPKPARDGVRNGLSNLGEPLTFANDLLQGKPKRAMRTLFRFVVNSAIGVFGLFDIAKRKPFNLPHHGNSFGDTLGFYGVKPGPYIYLPLLGPTTLRDLIGSQEGRVQTAIYDNPITRGDRGTAATVIAGLDQRAENDSALKALLDDAVDPYATFRSTWLQNRKAEIQCLKAPDGKEPCSEVPTGNMSSSPFDDPLTDPAAPANPDTATPIADPAENP